jgi:hypothetical protein
MSEDDADECAATVRGREEDADVVDERRKKKVRGNATGKTPPPAKRDTIRGWVKMHKEYVASDVGGNIDEKDVGTSSGLRYDMRSSLLMCAVCKP